MTNEISRCPGEPLHAGGETFAPDGIVLAKKTAGEVIMTLMMEPNRLDEVVIKDDNSDKIYVAYGNGLDTYELTIGSPVSIICDRARVNGHVLMNLDEVNEFWEGTGDYAEGLGITAVGAVVGVFGYALNAVAGMSLGVGSGGSVLGMGASAASWTGFGTLIGGAATAVVGLGYMLYGGYEASTSDGDKLPYYHISDNDYIAGFDVF